MRVLCIAGLAVLTAASSSGADLPRSSPEAQGVSSAAVLAFVEAADKDIDSLHSFMLVRHGHVVAEGWWAPYAAESPHMLFSLSKSFTVHGRRAGGRRGEAERGRPGPQVLPGRRPGRAGAPT